MYKTTNKHPWLKEGIQVKEGGGGYAVFEEQNISVGCPSENPDWFEEVKEEIKIEKGVHPDVKQLVEVLRYLSADFINYIGGARSFTQCVDSYNKINKILDKICPTKE